MKIRAFGNVVKIWTIVAAIGICAAIALGCAKTDGTNAGSSEPAQSIVDVTVVDTTAEYDAKEHGISITGIADGDEVSYSTDGSTWSKVEPKFASEGRHTVYVKVERAGCEAKIYTGKVEITRTLLSGIAVQSVRKIYDGAGHLPQITGTNDGDRITYKIDGTDADGRAPIEIGRYEIEIEVERLGSGYYIGNGSVEIVPDISGIYVARDEIIQLTENSAIIDGEEYLMEYDHTGNGTIEGKGEFRVEDALFSFAGNEYIKPSAAERIYEIEIAEQTVYAVGTVGAAEIAFGESATLRVDGEDVITLEGYNYCERAEREDGTEISIQRRRGETNVTFTAESSARVMTINIVLSQRAEQSLADATEEVFYDGQMHGIAAEFAGIVYCKTEEGYTTELPEYGEAGEYEYELVIERDGYLPKKITYTLKIVPMTSGVFANANGVIEINGKEVKINGEAGDFDDITVVGDTVEYNGAEYSKMEEMFAVIRANGTLRVLMLDDEEDTYIIAQGDRIEVENGANSVELTCGGTIAKVIVDGVELLSIYDGFYILGATEISDRQVVVIDII